MRLVDGSRLKKMVLWGFRTLMSEGPKVLAVGLFSSLSAKRAYARWIKNNDTLDDSDISAIRQHVMKLNRKPVISVLLPVYNTPEDLLRRTVESVREQLYEFWELCIADDASTEPHVWRTLEDLSTQDGRIRVIRRDTNGHISEASNTCLDMASGEFCALLDHDDELAPHALYLVAASINDNPDVDILYSDEDKIDENGRRFGPYFKPDWNRDLFLAQNMISHLGVYRTSLMRQVGGFRAGFEGSQDWDLALRVSELTDADRIAHLPYVLYHWRTVAGSTAVSIGAKPYAVQAGIAAVTEHLARTGCEGVVDLATESHLRVKRKVPTPYPLVSIIIVSEGDEERLLQGVERLIDGTTYDRIEVSILRGGAGDLSYRQMQDIDRQSSVRFLENPSLRSPAGAMNFAASSANGDFVCFLSADIEIITPEWLEELVSQAARAEIGAVGPMLYNSNDSIRHAGYILGPEGFIGHAYSSRPRGTRGYLNRACLAQNVSALSGACLVLKRQDFIAVGGFDAENLPTSLYDVDLCLRLMEMGRHNLWTPHAELYHHSRGRGRRPNSDAASQSRAQASYFNSRWTRILNHDPAYNPNLAFGGNWGCAAARSRVKRHWLPG